MRIAPLSALLCLTAAYAAETSAECRYGADAFTQGARSCQAGTVMQCEVDGDGRYRWVATTASCEPPHHAPSPADAAATAAPASGASSPPAESGMIEIAWAQFGRDGHYCDAAQALGGHCGGKHDCDVPVRPQELCAPPDTDKRALLTVYWRCGPSADLRPTAFAQEGGRLKLDCADD